jgi:predicted esterase
MERRRLQRCMAGLAVAAFLAACSGNAAPSSAAPSNAAPSAPAETGVTQVGKDIVYAKALSADAKDVAFDVYAPAGTGPWPVVIWVAGGESTKFDAGPFGRKLAEQGLVVFVPDVAHPTNEGFAADPWTTDRMIGEQAACVVRHVRAIAADHGGSPDRVTWAGTSLGGVIGLSAALADPQLDKAWETAAAKRGGPPAQFSCVTPTGSATIDAIAMSSGAMNLDLWPDVYAADPELLDFATATYRVGDNPGLKVRMINGTADEDVPIAAARATADRLTAAGYDVKLTVREGVGHDRNDVQLMEALAELTGP